MPSLSAAQRTTHVAVSARQKHELVELQSLSDVKFQHPLSHCCDVVFSRQPEREPHRRLAKTDAFVWYVEQLSTHTLPRSWHSHAGCALHIVETADWFTRDEHVAMHALWL